MGTMMRFGLNAVNVHTGFIHLVLLSMDSVSQIYFCALDVIFD